jgi:hypothetical protein
MIRLVSDVREKPGFPPEARHEIVEGRCPVAEQDHVWLVGQCPQRDLLVAREAVILRKRHHEGLAGNRLDRQRAIIDWRPHKRHLQPAFADGRELIRNAEGVHVEADALIALSKQTDQVWKVREVHPRGESDG